MLNVVILVSLTHFYVPDCEWDVEQYGKLLAVGGGKERTTAHWNGRIQDAGKDSRSYAYMKRSPLVRCGAFGGIFLPPEASAIGNVSRVLLKQYLLAVVPFPTEKGYKRKCCSTPYGLCSGTNVVE